MIISSFIVIILLIYTGMQFSSLCNLSRYYISLPLAGGILGIIVLVLLMAATGLDWKPEPIVGRLLVTCFLFFIGVRMGSIYTYKHLRFLAVFFLLTTGFLVLLELLSWLLLRDQTKLLATVGAMSFAWNDEWLMYMQGIHLDVSLIFYTSMLLVFLCTPLMLRLMSTPNIPRNRRTSSIGIPWIWRLCGFVLASVVSVLAYMIKQYWLEQIPFLFDLVVSMGIGIGLGLYLRIRGQLQHSLVYAIASVGTWGLFGFIIFMMLMASHEIWFHGSWLITALLSIKLIVLSGILVILSKRFILTHKHLIWFGAAWAFILSAPVTCMNAMRTVTDQHSEADDVILIVPPVILWMINYPHYYIFIWLYGAI